MSFIIIRCPRHIQGISQVCSDVRLLQRACFHRSSCLHDDDPKMLDMKKEQTPALKVLSKTQIVSRSIQAYLKQKQDSDRRVEKATHEYDLGKRHLANMMGLDPDEPISKEDIQVAINYLFPSGLSNKKARPLMEHPLVLQPPRITQEFDNEGRPAHYLHYTKKPNYFGLMHDLAVMYEDCKRLEVENTFRQEKIDVSNSELMSYRDFANHFLGEKVNENDYERLKVLMDRLIEHPLAVKHKDFLLKWRVTRTSEIIQEEKEPLRDAEGRLFYITRGSRKKAKAIVTVKNQGSGQWLINGKDITYFQDHMLRQTILSPLQLCGVIDKFDVLAKVEGGGPSSQAGAIRYAVAKGVYPFMTSDLRDKLRIAGYMTSDPRVKERKKPGQTGARMKWTWKRR